MVLLASEEGILSQLLMFVFLHYDPGIYKLGLLGVSWCRCLASPFWGQMIWSLVATDYCGS